MALSGANERERKHFKIAGLIGIALASLGLGAMNITGAWIVSGGSPQWATFVTGLEVCALVFLSLTVVAQTLLRKIVGLIITAVVIIICVENGKFAVRELFDEIFVASPKVLRDQARIVREGVTDLETGHSTAENRRDSIIADKRRQIAELETEQRLMADPNRVREAQQRLQSLGEYRGEIDGVYGDLTRQAMLARGGVIAREIEVLRNEVDGLEGSVRPSAQAVDMGAIDAMAVTLTPAQLAQTQADQLEAKAREVEYYETWMHFVLYGGEAVRGLALWALIMSSTATGTGRRQHLEEAAAETITPEDLKAKVMRDEGIEEAFAQPTPVPKPEPEDPRANWTKQQWDAHKGALARQAYDEARKASRLRMGPVSAFNVIRQEAAE